MVFKFKKKIIMEIFINPRKSIGHRMDDLFLVQLEDRSADNRLSTSLPQNISVPIARRGTEETAGDDKWTRKFPPFSNNLMAMTPLEAAPGLGPEESSTSEPSRVGTSDSKCGIRRGRRIPQWV